MSIGVAIFLSGCLIALVLLYGFTKDRWRWRRLILAMLGMIVIVAAGIAGIFWWADRRDEVKGIEQEAREREEHAVRIGDDLSTVLRRHGQPDTTVLRESGELTFGYGPRYGRSTEINKVFHFDSDSTLTGIRFIGDAQHSIEYGWIPRDRVQLGLDRAAVLDALGPPCAEKLEEEHTQFAFPTEDATVIRYVHVAHGKQRVSLHGWARNSCPTPDDTLRGEADPR